MERKRHAFLDDRAPHPEKFARIKEKTTRSKIVIVFLFLVR